MSKNRWVVERACVSIKRWLGSGMASYKGLTRLHAQHLIDAIAYNLYRAFGIIISCS
ncbi:MAG: transposase [Flavobacteriales bacterium Tduv]